MGIFIVESAVCCLDLFEKCSSHHIQQTFQKVFHNGNASSVSFHLVDSQRVRGSLLTAGFSSALNTPPTRWQRTLYSVQLLLSLSQSNFSCFFPVVSEPLFLCGASFGLVVNGACVAISNGSCELRTKNHFPCAFRNISTSLYPA